MEYGLLEKLQKEESWSYIQSLDPDVSLLNECSTHNSQKNHIHYIAKDKWGCGVFSKHPSAMRIILKFYFYYLA